MIVLGLVLVLVVGVWVLVVGGDAVDDGELLVEEVVVHLGFSAPVKRILF
ncbi:hypothetical protein RA264_27475 [Pseudomonas syringae pv. tagetis]